MARSQGAGLKGEGPHGKAPGRPGRCSAATARTRWESNPNPTPADMRAYRGGDGGVVRLPRLVFGRILWTVTDALLFFGRTMSKLLTMDQASEYLGVSKLTLYGWVSARKLSYIKVGRLVKFKQDQLDKWIDQRTVKGGDDRFNIRTREGIHGSH